MLKLDSLGTSSRRLIACYDSVASRAGIKGTCADMDRESVVSSLFGSMSKEKRDRDQSVVQTLKKTLLNRKLKCPPEEKNWLSKDHTKLMQKF